MKKRGVLLAVLALALCLCALPASAGGTLMFSAQALTANQGDDIAFSIQVEGNDREMAGCKLILQCDTTVLVPALTDGEGEDPDLAVTKGDVFSIGNVAGHYEPGCMKVAWWAFGRALSWNGELLSVRFHVAEDASPGVYPVVMYFEEGDVVDNSGAPIPASCHSGSVTVPGRYTGPGDVNGDNRTDVRDMACLFDYLSTGRNTGWIPDPADLIRAADANGDGAVNILDYQALYNTVKSQQTA